MAVRSIQEILELQNSFLKYVINNADVSVPEIFLTGPHKECYSLIKEYYLKHSEIPNTNTLFEVVKERQINDRVYQTFIECQLAPDYNKGYLTEALEEEHTLRTVQFAVRNFNDDLNKGDNPKLLKQSLISTLLKETQDASVQGGFVWEDAPERWKLFKIQEASDRKLLGVPTHISCFDQNLSGFVRSRSYLIVGLPKTGKTILMLNMGYNIARYEREHVLFVSGEMGKLDLELRIDARDSMIDSLLIANANLAPSLKERYRESLSKQYDRKDPFYIVEPKPGFTPIDVASEVMKYEKKFGVLPHTVIVDYLWKMRSSRKVSGGRPEELGFIMEDLVENVCKRFNVALLTATQESRDGAIMKRNKKERGQESVGLSSQITPHVNAQWIIDVYHNTADLALMNKMFIMCDTNRNGPTFKSELVFLKEPNYIGDNEIPL